MNTIFLNIIVLGEAHDRHGSRLHSYRSGSVSTVTVTVAVAVAFAVCSSSFLDVAVPMVA